MARNRSQRGGSARSPYAFIIVCSILLIALVFVGARALNTWKVYETEAAVTPAPTATVQPVSVTPDPSRATAAPTASPVPSATPSYLNTGAQGAMVTELQTRLQALGYYTGKIDGDYGSGTRAAVELFQQVNGLDADGIAGQKTLSALNDPNALAKPQAVDVLAGSVPLLVNKWNPLPAGFEPADLVRVKDLAGELLLYERDSIQAVRPAVEALMQMVRAAREAGVSPWKLREAYRTLGDQKRILDNRVKSYMENGSSQSQALSIARREVADPGCSEHHTGLAFDLNVPGESFSDTAQYLWLKKNCWDYGFIMRYTDEKDEITGITGEEWHVRYVGVEHAQKMRDMDYCLEEYVEYLK